MCVYVSIGIVYYISPYSPPPVTVWCRYTVECEGHTRDTCSIHRRAGTIYTLHNASGCM